MKRILFVCVQAVAALALFLALIVGWDLFQQDSYLVRYKPLLEEQIHAITGAKDAERPDEKDDGPGYDVEAFRKKAPKFVKSIMNPEDKSLARMGCPRFNAKRYDYLRPSAAGSEYTKWFFALNLRQNADVLPRLMGSVVEAIRFLGPERCALSIVEGNSQDGTREVLEALVPVFASNNITFHFTHSDVVSSEGNRILKLARLRNQALEPLLDTTKKYADDTTVIFLNDVIICTDDILELVHQKVWLGADMTCGMDWSHVTAEPTFYDAWVARAINGDSFFRIPTNSSWEFAEDLFWSDRESQDRFAAHKSVQVFACWNGGAVFDARPIMDGKIEFREHREKECYSGEPTLFCKDLWYMGRGKIAVIPTVNLEYDTKHAIWVKGKKGFATDLLDTMKEDDSFKIVWKGPPKQVRCIVNWEDQFWVPWDENLN